MTAPYRSTPVFDENTLPPALRKNHSTKQGVWGLIRVLEGQVRLNIIDPPSETVLSPDKTGVVLPQQLHYVTPLGSVRMQVDFYDAPPPAVGT